METGTIIILIIAAIVYLGIIYVIIRAATDTNEQTHYQRTMLRMVARLLQEKGISDSELEEIVNAHPALPIVQKTKSISKQIN